MDYPTVEKINANHTAVSNPDGSQCFFSYDSLVATVDTTGHITLGKNWDYSATTRRHLLPWLGLANKTETICKLSDGEISFDPNMV